MKMLGGRESSGSYTPPPTAADAPATVNQPAAPTIQAPTAEATTAKVADAPDDDLPF